jgi:multidrug efflux pump subunit AcrA (membrane-fusion protein)
MRPTNLTYKLFLILAITCLALSGCSSLQAKATPTPEVTNEDEFLPLVSATGVVAPAQHATLSLTTSGVIDEVFVQQGDTVQAGQVLARLKGKEDLQAAVANAKFEVSAAQKALDDLTDSAETSRTQALEAISVAAQQVRDAQYQLDNFTVPQNQIGMSTMEAYHTMKQKLDQARAAFEPYKFYSSGNKTRKDLKEKLDEAQSDFNAAVKRLEYEYALEVAQDNLDKALQDYETLKEGPDPEEVAVAQARLDNAQASLAAAQAALEDLELRASINGTVSELYVHTGEWVGPGQAILELADLGHLRVETTDLNEIDAARVKVGDPVTVTFDALPEVQIAGTVERIAPKSAKGSGVNYTVIVELSEWPEILRWGMTAFVDILVQED